LAEEGIVVAGSPEETRLVVHHQIARKDLEKMLVITKTLLEETKSRSRL